jgi:hypothetical protein
VGHEVVGVGTLQHDDPRVGIGFQVAEQGYQLPHELGSDQVQRGRVDHHAEHPLVGPGDA